jgi:hypothetical protein
VHSHNRDLNILFHNLRLTSPNTRLRIRSNCGSDYFTCSLLRAIGNHALIHRLNITSRNTCCQTTENLSTTFTVGHNIKGAESDSIPTKRSTSNVVPHIQYVYFLVSANFLSYRSQVFKTMHIGILVSLFFAAFIRNGLCQTNSTSAVWCHGLEACGHNDNICCEDVMVDGAPVHTYCEAMPSLPFQIGEPVDSICCPFGQMNCGGVCCGDGKTCEYIGSTIVVGGLKVRDVHIPPQVRGLFPPISGGQWQCLDQPILP